VTKCPGLLKIALLDYMYLLSSVVIEAADDSRLGTCKLNGVTVDFAVLACSDEFLVLLALFLAANWVALGHSRYAE
jgi:hypothetical protein